MLARLDRTLRDRLAAYGRGAERWGLIHADLRLANLLARPGSPTAVIDFDDCGFGWYLYDFGAAVSFIEDHPDVPAATDQWVAGYRRVAPLATEEEAELRDVRDVPPAAAPRLDRVARRRRRRPGAGSDATPSGPADLAEDYLSSHT